MKKHKKHKNGFTGYNFSLLIIKMLKFTSFVGEREKTAENNKWIF